MRDLQIGFDAVDVFGSDQIERAVLRNELCCKLDASELPEPDAELDDAELADAERANAIARERQRREGLT